MDGLATGQVFTGGVETASRSELAALQERRLLDILPRIVSRSALLRTKWAEAGVDPASIVSIEDYKRRAPFIDKDDIRVFRDAHDDPYGGLLCCAPEELTAVASTSGTTGDPTPYPFRWQLGAAASPSDYWEGDMGGQSRPTLRNLRAYGIGPGDYVALFIPTFRGPSFRLFQEAGGIPILFDHHPAELPRFVELARRLRPKLMYLLSNPLILGLEQLERETGLDLVDVFSSIHTVVFGGEPLSGRAKGLLERWGVKVHEHASLGDVGTIWECPARAGMHAWEDYCLVEVIDHETGEEAPDGARGELVVTALTNDTAPLVRFRSGDLVKVDRSPCACGSTHVRLWPIGRAGDEVVVDGKVVLPRDVWEAVERVPETAAGLFQIIRPDRTLTSLKLRVGYAGATDLAALRDTVASSVERIVGVRPEIDLVPNEELLKLGPPHKIPRTAKA